MARANLRGLIGNLGDAEAVESPPPLLEEVQEQPAPEPEKISSPVPASEIPEPLFAVVAAANLARSPSSFGAENVEHFTSFQRKETRLRADQQNALTEHARRLNRAKGTGGQRITDNTLIRVAVDLLLSRSDKLGGRDEGELRRSVGLTGRGR